jgi:hypothetical protein
MKPSQLAHLLLLAVALSSSLAFANGRFPRAERLLEDPNDSDHLLLAATYGLLSTTNRGQTWHHICEASFGVFSATADPLLELSDAGILGSLLQGVTLSENLGCDFAQVLGGQGQTTPDISVDKSDRARVLGLTKSMSGTTVVSQLHESLDGGRTFEQVGSDLPAGFDFPQTLDSAPSDPLRVYVSGVSGDNVGQVLRSDDGGKTWEAPVTLPGTSYINAPFIAAVAPERADLLFVRTNGRELVNDETWAKDSLFVGDLSGQQGCGKTPGFCETFTVRAKLFGFALSPEGDHVLIGLGDPQDPAFRVDQRFVGLYSGTLADLLAAAPGATFPPPGFTKVHAAPVSCVTWNTTGIYVCTSQTQKGFALGFAPDLAGLEADELTPLLDLAAVRGPLACDEPSSTWQCSGEWLTTCQTLGACGNEGGQGGASGGDGGQGGAAESGGTGTVAGGGQGGSQAGRSFAGTAVVDESMHRSADEDSGCGCAVVSDGRGTRRAWLGLALSLLALVRRRTSARQSADRLPRRPVSLASD